VNSVKIGHQIRRIRQSKDLSQENIASELEITKGAFSKIERGATNVPITRLLQIAAVLEVDITEFFKDSKSVSISEEPKTQFGFATKHDFEELVNMIKEVNQEVNILKATVQKLEEVKSKTRKK
jgi:transcriptional regulator with XRE-family HTH domain